MSLWWLLLMWPLLGLLSRAWFNYMLTKELGEGYIGSHEVKYIAIIVVAIAGPIALLVAMYEATTFRARDR